MPLLLAALDCCQGFSEKIARRIFGKAIALNCYFFRKPVGLDLYSKLRLALRKLPIFADFFSLCNYITQ